MHEQTRAELLGLTGDIVSAYVSKNSVAPADLPAIIEKVHTSLVRAGRAAAAALVREPAVPVRASIRPDHLVCLEDGRHLQMLKRHLMECHGLSPEAYRARWNLPADYPMAAPNVAAKRRETALGIGLGRRGQSRRPRRPGPLGQ